MSSLRLGAPETYTSVLEIDGLGKDYLSACYRKMVLIRESEFLIAKGRKDGLIGGPVHLGVGQEAVAVGVCEHLTCKDAVFGAHRSHSQLLAMGSDPYRLFCETLGRSDGLSGGRGGSMHLIDEAAGFRGSVPIVAGTVPLATGAALAFKLQNLDAIAVAFFGDGAMEEGVVHESLNFAKIHNLPMVFVVENNLFSSHMHITTRQPDTFVSRYAEANLINTVVVDGNNPIAVSNGMKKLVDDIKKGNGPGFLEAITYRWLGHVDWRDDIDVGVNRSATDLQNWKKTDPIGRLKESMLHNHIVTADWFDRCDTEIQSILGECWNKAVSAPLPEVDSLLDNVYQV